MIYEFPQGLLQLRNWLEAQGLDVGALKSERQAAFMAQQLAGTRYKFPAKGASCLQLLQQIQRALPDSSAGDPAQLVRSASAKGPVKPRKEGRRKNETEAINLDSGLVIFADGACEPNPGPGGWGYVVYRDGLEVHADCGGECATTNNVMEMTGALMALQWLSESGLSEAARLVCDSQYVVKGCNDWRHAWKKKGWKRGPNKELANADLWQQLDAMLASVPITLEWVKGHAGIGGNERADELATIGMERAQ